MKVIKYSMLVTSCRTEGACRASGYQDVILKEGQASRDAIWQNAWGACRLNLLLGDELFCLCCRNIFIMSQSYHPSSRGDKGSLSAVRISYSLSHPPQICCGIVNGAAEFWNNILEIKTLYLPPFPVLVTGLLGGAGCSFLAERMFSVCALVSADPVSGSCFPALYRDQSTEEVERACGWDQKPRAGLLGQQLFVFKVGGCIIWPGLSRRGQEGQQKCPKEKVWLYVWYLMFVHPPRCSALGRFCPHCSSYRNF